MSEEKQGEREIMFLAQLTLGAAQDRRVGTGMRRRMFGIAEAMVDSAAFSDQQFAVAQLWQSPPPHPHSRVVSGHFQLLRDSRCSVSLLSLGSVVTPKAFLLP